MAGSFNKVMLMGNLTRDVELRHLPGSNVPVASFGIAVNRKYRTRDGENREEVNFIDCETMGRTAEVMNQYLAKGRPVFLEGRLKYDQWEDKQSGQKRSKLKVFVENFQFVDSAQGGGSRGGGGGGGAPAYESASGPHQPVTEDDIPF